EPGDRALPGRASRRIADGRERRPGPRRAVHAAPARDGGPLMPGDYGFGHGMGTGAWGWGLVGDRLAARGRRVFARDLPGHGRRAAEWRHASVQSYAHSVADAMAREGVRDAVLVGHSMGGIVVPKVAELVPARVGHLVFLAAVVLPSGTSLDQ